ncbi:AMP-dependent synthetase/ligase [Fodinicola feengrottensis]|uniref:Acyl-CoA synthetase n=1 Tax=Fodinicola feengrottensis TaxID=435914 RepID=A0ABN2H130_9ACTN
MSLDTWWIGPTAPRSLADITVRHAEKIPDKVVMQRRVDREWQQVTAAQFHAEVVEVAKGLIARGVGAGERVALMSKTRYEWTLCDAAIWAAGAVTVPVYETSSADQLEWILGDSGAVAAIVETPGHDRRLAGLTERLRELRDHWVIDGKDAGHTLASLIEAGREVDDAELDRRRANLNADKLATIIYTSGTTGRPKGCELTHGNFLAEITSAIEALPELFESEDASTLLFLPLAHVFGRMIQMAVLMSAAKLAHSDVGRLTVDLIPVKPTFVLAVPRVFERVYDRARSRAVSGGKEKIFDRAVNTAINYSKALEKGRPGPIVAAQRALFDKLVYSKLRDAMGGEVRWAVSGGSALGSRLAHFFRGAGVTVLEGYGLTETTAAAAVNTRGHIKVGTVGRALPGFEISIGQDNEILLRGGHVFHRYWNNETGTKEALTDDGWFRTGDLGKLDADGYLTITGRKKEILVTTAGKNVSPGPLEDVVRAHPLISQALVVGDGRNSIAALITIDTESLPQWLETHGRDKNTAVADLVEDPALLAELKKPIDAANATVSAAEKISRFRVLSVDFTEEGGHITPSLKLKRAIITRDFADDIEALYAPRKGSKASDS